tara:strand:+ start:640 stop:1254 length:615 start_codon:yes stop_codon:yes gene_type:complete
MAAANYFVITVARCDPTYVPTAMEQIGSVINDLKSKAGAIVVRAGIITTGEQAGSLALFQAYEGMDGFEKALDVYAASSDYAAMMASGKVSVVMRNLLKMHAVPFDQNTTKTPKFIVLTRATAADTMIDTVTQLAPIFADGGALTLRYGTLVTGSNAGNRLLGVTYPSMAAIEKTYDALATDAAYQAALSSFNVNLRAIVRVLM